MIIHRDAETGKVTKSFKGLTVKTYTKDKYYDRYYYAVVYNKGTFEDILTGCTRQSDPMDDVEVDAPEDLMARYKRYCDVSSRWKRRANIVHLAKVYKIGNYRHVKKLMDAYYTTYEDICADRTPHVERLLKLMGTKKFRSEFRKSIYDQVNRWLDGKTDYRKPLTNKQLYSI